MAEFSLAKKEGSHSNLIMEDFTNADYIHAKRICKDFEIKNWVNVMICILKVIHYYWLIFLKNLEICVWKIIN